jgi:hypothetical protein
MFGVRPRAEAHNGIRPMRAFTLIRFAVVSSLVAVAFAACGSGKNEGFGDPSAAAGGAEEDAQAGPQGFGDAAQGDGAAATPIGNVTGKVVAPEGTIPIAEALVYLTDTLPPAIPPGVYCDKCVQLTSNAFTYSKPDGTFDLPAYASGSQYIVTQKGQFRRVRPITIATGTQTALADATRLPGHNDLANGDTIPSMKVMAANWDSIASSLHKLGVTEFAGPPSGLFTVDHTLDDANEAAKYHVIFIPCSGQVNDNGGGGNGNVCSGIYTPSSKSKTVMKSYIEQGGKLYVTDWSYEYVRQIWPGYVHFGGETAAIGSACTLGEYSGPAEWSDPKLDQWMTANGEGNAELKKSYVQITSTAPQPGFDETGKSVTVTPKVWAKTMVGGAPRTSTVSFQDRCGRVMYSTYHAEGTDNGGSKTLLAQEKALFHILLEVSECVGVKPVPPIK